MAEPTAEIECRWPKSCDLQPKPCGCERACPEPTATPDTVAPFDVVRELREHPFRSAWGARVADVAAHEIERLRQRACPECVTLRAERDALVSLGRQAEQHEAWMNARLAEVEAERDFWKREQRLHAAEARIAQAASLPNEWDLLNNALAKAMHHVLTYNPEGDRG